VTVRRVVANLCRQVIWRLDPDPNWSWPEPGDPLRVRIVRRDGSVVDVAGTVSVVQGSADRRPAGYVAVVEG
jgi:hypothetical protein